MLLVELMQAANSMEDIGLKSCAPEVQFQPVPFKDAKDVYWFPAQASVEVETPRQHAQYP